MSDLAIRPNVRNNLVLTNAMVRQATITANSGNLLYLAQIVERQLADDTVSGALEARIKALLGSKMVVSGTVEQEFREDYEEMLPDCEIGPIMAWRLMLGLCPVQLCWITGKSGRLIPQVTLWPAGTLRYEWGEGAWSSVSEGVEVDIPLGQGQWSIFSVAGYKPWTHGKVMAISDWYMAKHYAMADWSQHSENAAVLWIKTPEGTEKGIRDQLASAVQKRGKNGVLAPPGGTELNLTEANSNTYLIYQAQIAEANRAIAIALRGGNLTTINQGGSFGATSAQLDVELGLVRADAKAYVQWLKCEVVKYWLLYNFPPNATLDLNFAVGADPDRLERANMLKAWAEALKTLRDVQLTIDTKPLSDELDVELKPLEASPTPPAIPQPSPPPPPNPPTGA